MAGIVERIRKEKRNRSSFSLGKSRPCVYANALHFFGESAVPP
jgi:hypothetical protein